KKAHGESWGWMDQKPWPARWRQFGSNAGLVANEIACPRRQGARVHAGAHTPLNESCSPTEVGRNRGVECLDISVSRTDGDRKRSPPRHPRRQVNPIAERLGYAQLRSGSTVRKKT